MSIIVYVQATVFAEMICEKCGNVEGDRYNEKWFDIGESYDCDECGHTNIVTEEEFRDE